MASVSASLVWSFLYSILSMLLFFHGIRLAQTQRSCPTDKFCPIGADCTDNTAVCVTLCPNKTVNMQQGNWTSGRCERIPSGTRHWMDSTFYEVFILTNQPTNTSIRNLFFISSESFRTNDGTLVDLVEDITFTLNSSCPYFYFDEMNKTEVVFENYFDLYVPDTIEVVELFLAEPIPPDDYEMQVIVTSSGIVLETRDIVVHVTRDPVCLKPPCPIQDTSVVFTASNFNAFESTGTLVVTLESSGTIKLQSFTIYVIAEADNSTIFPATDGHDFISGRYNATFAPGATTATVNIPIVDDTIDEPNNETFNLRLYIDGAGYQLGLYKGDTSKATVSILEDIIVRFSQFIYNIEENSGVVQPVLLLSYPVIHDVTFNVSEISGTATESTDYIFDSYSVIIPAGVISYSFDIQIIDDGTLEENESFTLSIINSSLPGGIVAGDPSQTTIVIINNDNLTVEFASGQFTGSESSGFVEVVVRVAEGMSSIPITVTVTSSVQSPVSARDGDDFNGGRMTVNILAGVLSQTFRLSIIDDNIVECSEKFTVVMTSVSPNEVAIGTSRSSEVIITDNDRALVSMGQAQYSVAESSNTLLVFITLNAITSEDVAVGINVSDISTNAGLDYELSFPSVFNATIPAGMTSLSAPLNIINDMIQEDNETIHGVIKLFPSCLSLSLGVSSAIATIIDDDVAVIQFASLTFSGLESSGVLSVSIVILEGIISSKNITTQITFISETATGNNIDYSSTTQVVTIIAGTNSKIVNITVMDDNIVENNETFIVGLALPSSLGPRIMTGSIISATGIIIDTSTLTIEFTSSNYSNYESSGNISVALLLKGGTSSTDINVIVTPSNQSPLSAEGGKDYTSSPITATFAAGTTSTVINVPISNDNHTEVTEAFNLDITIPNSLDGRITLGDKATAVGSIIDNSKSIVEFTSSQFTGSESAGSVTVMITKSNALSITNISALITLTPMSAMGSGVDFDSTPLMITFTPKEIDKTITIPVMCDNLIEGEEMFNIHLSIASISHNLTVEVGLNKAIGVITDSTVDATFAQSEYRIREDFISLTPLIKLSQSSSVTFKLSINLIDVTTTVADHDQQSILITVAPGTLMQQFTVNITNDNIVECTEEFTLSISAEKTVCGLNSSNGNARVIVNDDDIGIVNIVFDRQTPLLVVESAGSLVVNLLLNASVSADITILTTMTDITASVGSDYSQNGLSSQLTSSVNILSGLTSGLILINIIDNKIQEPNETFNVALQLQSSCLPVALIGQDTFTITIIDDEELTVEFDQAMFSGREASGTIVITLNLVGGTASVNFTVSVSTSSVTATENIDYDPTTITATFFAGSTTASVEIPIFNDTTVDEDDETLNLTLNLLSTTDVRVAPGIHSTATATIIDTTPPQIYVHPMDKSVKINNNSASAIFNCMAYGASSYYWLKETDEIPFDATGIRSNRLTLHNILPRDNGRYQCIAENEHGKTPSNYGMLTVKALPPVVSIVSEKEIKVKKGERVEFTCSATGLNSSDFIYNWYLNDRLVVGQGRPTLVIDIVSEDDTGYYQCFVRNPYNGVGQSELAQLILNQFCYPTTVNYTTFTITWNETQAGATIEAACTGSGLNGNVRRRCIRDDHWEEFFECFNEKTAMLLHQATNLTLSLNNLNETEKITKTSNIANALVNITAPTQEQVFAQDINLAVDIVSTLNNITGTVVANLTADDPLFEDTTSVIDNLLSDTNQDNWKQLERTSPSTSQTLVRSAEEVSILLSETLTNNTTKALKTKPNIVIKAERISNDRVEKGYAFPDENDNLTAYSGGRAQLMVSSSLLQDITAGSKELTIASTVIRNGSGLRLPSSNNETVVPQLPASPIFSLQINPSPDSNTLAKNPIMMMFDVDPNTALLKSEQNGVQNKVEFTIDDFTCNFYDYDLVTNDNLNQIGGWSTEGLAVDKNHSTKESVACLTKHLTSFAVLVSIQDERPPSTTDKVLSIISYIGCSISLACLCISIIFLSFVIHKTREKKNHLFIHLNLCIALALGLVVFIAGIENATNNEIGCKLVAVLLQYLFICAFCWMLCEGVMLYMMLVTVFGNKLNKRRFFFILGWGPAIPIVAVSIGTVHEHYGTDQYCWIKSDEGAIAAFIAPIVTIILINCIFLLITVKVLWANQQTAANDQSVSNKDTVKNLLKAMIVLLPLLGLTWIIGIFAVNNNTQVFAWIFAILNSLQGVFIFIFHVIRNKQVIREMRDHYNLMKRSEAFRRLLSVRGGTASTNTLGISGKTRTSQGTSSEVSYQGKKISTTSFGSCTIGGEYSSLTLERPLKDKSEILEDTVFVEETNQIKLTTFKKLEEYIMEENEAGVVDKLQLKNSNKEKKKSITEDDVDLVAEKKDTVPTVKEKPVVLPRNKNN